PEDTPASRARDTPTGMTPTIDEEDGDEEDDFADEEARPRRRRWPWAFGVIILVLVVAGAGYAGYQYTQMRRGRRPGLRRLLAGARGGASSW
ncbi:MAG: hypothetical protein ACJ72W_02480, partial [Actinoallomurus sp.]